MIEPKRAPAGIVVVIFTVAMFCASVCSTACAMGICPNQEQHSDFHDCDHSSSHHSQSSHNHSPQKPDCSKHEHPGLFVVQAATLSQFQLSITGHLSTSELPASSLHDLTVSMTASGASDLAPPPTLKIPLYQQISVLRI
jgi:hypothetical protein